MLHALQRYCTPLFRGLQNRFLEKWKDKNPWREWLASINLTLIEQKLKVFRSASGVLNERGECFDELQDFFFTFAFFSLRKLCNDRTCGDNSFNHKPTRINKKCDAMFYLRTSSKIRQKSISYRIIELSTTENTLALKWRQFQPSICNNSIFKHKPEQTIAAFICNRDRFLFALWVSDVYQNLLRMNTRFMAKDMSYKVNGG